jgi:hypothetical protein
MLLKKIPKFLIEAELKGRWDLANLGEIKGVWFGK